MDVNTLTLTNVTGTDVFPCTVEFPPGVHVVTLRESAGIDEWFAIVTGMQRPRRGTVTLRGRNPNREPDLRSHIGSLLPTEGFPARMTTERELRNLGFSDERREALRTVASAIGAPLDAGGVDANGKSPRMNDRVLSLCLALSLEDPFLLVLYEPFAELNAVSRSVVLERLLNHGRSIPVVIVTAEPSLSERLGSRSLEWRQNSLRQPLTSASESYLMRVSGLGLRTLTGELSKRPQVRSLRYVAETDGRETLWIESRDPRQLTLDLVRIARQLEIRIHSLETSGVAP